MVHALGAENMLRISFSVAAFIFGVALCIFAYAMGTYQVHMNLKFRTLALTVVLGDLVSILDYFLRLSKLFTIPQFLAVFLLLAVYEFNTFLLYFMARYMEGFFGDFKHKALIDRINTVLAISSLAIAITVYIYRLFIYQGPQKLDDLPMWVGILLGYVYEVYFLLFGIILFIIMGNKISRRARITAVTAYAIVIISVGMELLNTIGAGPGILYNYFGGVLGLYIFYTGVETPDYKNLLQSMKDLETARVAADDANRSKSAFLANMSHEIRTPINAVIGMNEMILRESSEDNILEYARDIEGAGKNLLSIINDILDLSKIEAGKMEIVDTPYSLGGLVNDVVNMITFKCREKRLDFIIDIDPSLPRRLSGDEVRIRQIIINLLNNAVKYTKEGSVTFKVSGEKEGDTLILSVSVKDTGIGIKDEDKDKIFGKFNRVDLDNNRGIEGTGLGLAITGGLLEAMDGHVHVDSEYGKGTEFLIHVPQKVVDNEPVGEYSSGYKDIESEQKKYSEAFRAPEVIVLHVDDTAVNHTVMKNLLKKTGVKIDTAMNGQDSIIKADEKKYDLIFMDYRMPKMDGVEALRHIKESESGMNADTPIICLTADAVSGARERYISEGFTDYLTKPVDAVLLEEVMMKYLPAEKLIK